MATKTKTLQDYLFLPSILFFASLVLLLLLLLLLLPSVSSDGLYFNFVAPLTKDNQTSLYSIHLQPDENNENYVIDLGGSILWYKCPEQGYYPSVDCPSTDCSEAQSYFSPLCPPVPDRCPCTVTTVNPVTNTCILSQLTYKPLVINWTDGHNPSFTLNMTASYVSCAPNTMFSSLPVDSSGVAGFSRLPYALPTQFTPYYFEVNRTFSICLPSTNAVPGVLFFGNGPFYIGPPGDDMIVDVTSSLLYTPLLKHPTNPEYYLDLKGIYIGGEPSPISALMLALDSSGQGGVKLSTVVPYTTLKRKIYSNFLDQFTRATSGIPRAKSVKPFDLCFKTSTANNGLVVPQIDLKLDNGVNWTISGSNSMKQVSNDVACFAFVDGGVKAEAAVVIGAFQMEDNFLMFDLEKSRLGFSSSLLGFGTNCSNFDFTYQEQV